MDYTGFLGFQEVEGLPSSIDNLMSTPPLFFSVVGTNSSTAFSVSDDVLRVYQFARAGLGPTRMHTHII